MKKISFLMLLAMVLLASCSTGDGGNSYSYTAMGFVDAYATSSKVVSYAISDDDSKIVFSNKVSVDWMAKTDSAYRAYIMCTISSDQQSETTTAELNSILQVKTLIPLSPSSVDPSADKADALILSDAGVASNKKYLNLQFSVPTGGVGDTSTMTFGVVADSVKNNTHYLHIFHDGQGATDTKSSILMASIPIESYATGDKIALSVPNGIKYVTYDFTK